MSAENDARIMTTLDIDLDSKDPALVAALVELKPLLHKILKIVRESPAEKPDKSNEDKICNTGFSKVFDEWCDGGFSKVHYTETITHK